MKKQCLNIEEKNGFLLLFLTRVWS